MKFIPLELPGAFRVVAEPHGDERGYFATVFEAEDFKAHSLCMCWDQEAQSLNLRRGTIRGLHWQEEPATERKLVRCTRGAVFDVLVDLRPSSPTFLAWEGVVLTGESLDSLYIPEGCAHGYQAMEDSSEVHYLISGRFQAELQRGLRWDDPTLGIAWPMPEQAILSARDASFPLLPNTLRRNP